MNKNLLFLTIISLLTIQSVFSATIRVWNQTGKELSVTARWNRIVLPKGKKNFKTKIIQPGSSCSFSPTLQSFYGLEWKNINDGVTHSILIPSPNSMQNGNIQIEPNGHYMINFNKDGVYSSRLLEKGVSSENRAFQANAHY